MDAVAIVLALASGVSIGFTLGRVFERIQWQHQFERFKAKHDRLEER